jgi:hypothetical protein
MPVLHMASEQQRLQPQNSRPHGLHAALLADSAGFAFVHQGQLDVCAACSKRPEIAAVPEQHRRLPESRLRPPGCECRTCCLQHATVAHVLYVESCATLSAVHCLAGIRGELQLGPALDSHRRHAMHCHAIAIAMRHAQTGCGFEVPVTATHVVRSAHVLNAYRCMCCPPAAIQRHRAAGRDPSGAMCFRSPHLCRCCEHATSSPSVLTGRSCSLPLQSCRGPTL